MIGGFRSSIVSAISGYLSGPLLYRSNVAVLFDHGHPGFRNFNSAIPVNDFRVKSYVDSFLYHKCVPVRVSVNKLNLVPNWILAGLVGLFRNGGGLGTASRISLSCFLILSCIYLPVSPM